MLHGAKEEKNILHSIKKRKANWIGHILCTICLLKHVNEGKIDVMREVTRRQGRRRKLLLGFLKAKTGYGILKEEVLERLWICRKTDCGTNE